MSKIDKLLNTAETEIKKIEEVAGVIIANDLEGNYNIAYPIKSGMKTVEFNTREEMYKKIETLRNNQTSSITLIVDNIPKQNAISMLTNHATMASRPLNNSHDVNIDTLTLREKEYLVKQQTKELESNKQIDINVQPKAISLYDDPKKAELFEYGDKT